MKITLGQFYPTNSPIHRTDPRVKFTATIVYITFLLMINNFWGYGFAALFIAFLIAISKIPPKLMFRGLRAIIFILVFATTINIFLTQGETVLLSIGFITITAEGLYLAAMMCSRLVLLITGPSLLTLTTSPIQLTAGIESLLSPFKIIKVPAHDIAMMMTIALRFIPTLGEEMDKIIKAQKARGADFDTGSLVKRARSLIPILVPLFVSAFKRADELSTAMEARCYRGDINRTKMKIMKLTQQDFYSIFILLLFCICIIIIRIV